MTELSGRTLFDLLTVYIHLPWNFECILEAQRSRRNARHRMQVAQIFGRDFLYTHTRFTAGGYRLFPGLTEYPGTHSPEGSTYQPVHHASRRFQPFVRLTSA